MVGVYKSLTEFLPMLEEDKIGDWEMVDGYVGFLCIDEDGEPLVAMHWEQRFRHMVGRYNSIFRLKMPAITPHVCRHTYCSNQAKAGMSPKTLQYLMGHSDIRVTLNTYTHVRYEDAKKEMGEICEVKSKRKSAM